MLRCAGRQASRLICTGRITATGAAAGASGTAAALGTASSVVAGSSIITTLDQLLLQLQRQRGQFRSVSSWLTPGRTDLAAAKSGGGSGDFGIATGLELEELKAQQQGKKRFDLDAPRGPFGTKSHPAIVESQFDERIVGCSGGTEDDEHDVTWFKLRKGEEHECPVCTQVFELKVVGEGGLPGAHH